MQKINQEKRVVTSLAFSPDDKYLAAGSEDASVKIWQICGNNKFTLHQTFQMHKDTVYSVTFSSDGKQIASASTDKTIHIYHLSNGEFAYYKY